MPRNDTYGWITPANALLNADALEAAVIADYEHLARRASDAAAAVRRQDHGFEPVLTWRFGTLMSDEEVRAVLAAADRLRDIAGRPLRDLGLCLVPEEIHTLTGRVLHHRDLTVVPGNPRVACEYAWIHGLDNGDFADSQTRLFYAGTCAAVEDGQAFMVRVSQHRFGSSGGRHGPFVVPVAALRPFHDDSVW